MNDEYSQQCIVCNNIPDGRQMFQCLNKHNMCIICGLKSGRTCKIDNTEMLVTNNVTNRIVDSDCLAIPSTSSAVLSKLCPFTKNGCQWKFRTMAETQEHLKECKYRPYSCVGNTLKVWNCEWRGTHETFEEHAVTVHPHLREHFKYWHTGTVPFSFNQTIRMAKLVDAFNKKFVFYYNSIGENDHLMFTIYLMGRKCDADKYLIDFEVRKDERKIKFLEKCHTDTDEDIEALANGGGFVLSKKMVESFVEGDKIHFRFIIKRKEIVEEENNVKEEHLKTILQAKATEKSSSNIIEEMKPINAMKAMWNDRANVTQSVPVTPVQQLTQMQQQPPQSMTTSSKFAPKVVEPLDYLGDISRDFDTANADDAFNGRPAKMNMSALADIVQSLNLKRGSGSGNGNNNNNNSNNNVNVPNDFNQQQTNSYNQRFGGKILRKKFPGKMNDSLNGPNNNGGNRNNGNHYNRK